MMADSRFLGGQVGQAGLFPHPPDLPDPPHRAL
jgi:hypothetical protein